MSKDDKDTKRRITILERRMLLEPSTEEVAGNTNDMVDCWVLINQSFATTEDTKRYLRVHGEADGEYLIVQAKANVTLSQQMITKLTSVPVSVA